MSSNNGKYLKKWLLAYHWAMSQKHGFERKDFLKANPGFKTAGNNVYLRHLVDLGFLVKIPIHAHKNLYVPRPVFEFCGHGMVGSACPWCGQEQKERIDAIHHATKGDVSRCYSPQYG